MPPRVKQNPKAIVTLFAVLAFGVTSMTANGLASTSLGATPTVPAPLSAPALVAKPAPLVEGELEKYQALAAQSVHLASSQTAGASKTTTVVLITVGVVAVVAAALAIGSHNASHVTIRN